MSTPSLTSRVEAILYLKGRPTSLSELAELTSDEPDQVRAAIAMLTTSYAQRDTALEVVEQSGRYCLQLRPALADLVKNMLPVNLSTATLRTLATIALKKRILLSDLVDLRGSGAYDHIKELLAQDFIERRRQSDGRSYWLSLSEKFHRIFTKVFDFEGGLQIPPLHEFSWGELPTEPSTNFCFPWYSVRPFSPYSRRTPSNVRKFKRANV